MSGSSVSDSSRVMFVGHSTVLLRLGPLIVITDPNFSRRIWTLRRRDEPGMRPEDIHRLDVILISHGHYDHLDMRSLKRLPPGAVAIVPPGLDKFPRKAGITDVRTLRWWEETEVKGASITAVPAAHFPGRSPLTPRSLFQGYVVQADRTVYYAGDTGLFEAMVEIGRRFSPDLALLPIGAYNPWARYGHHMSPEDAIEALKRVRARHLVPIHWGAFKLSLEPMEEPPLRLREAARKEEWEDRVHILRPGETFTLP